MNFLFFIFYLFFYQVIFAKPELYDHLDMYKKKIVPLKGPSEEVVVSTEKDFTPSSAKYEYNNKNQLTRVLFYTKDKVIGETLFSYNEKGLHKEILKNEQGNIVENITYMIDENDNILSYKVDSENLVWKFQYKANTLKSGQRYVRGKPTEGFTFNENTSKNTSYITQDLFDEQRIVIGRIDYYYKKNILDKKVRRDKDGTLRIVQYNYNDLGVISEIRFLLDDGSGSKLIKVHRLK